MYGIGFLPEFIPDHNKPSQRHMTWTRKGRLVPYNYGSSLNWLRFRDETIEDFLIASFDIIPCLQFEKQKQFDF